MYAQNVQPETRTRLRLALVEDSEGDAVLLCDALEGGGFDVDLRRVWTLDGVRSVLEDPPDVLVSDYRLPGFDAVDVLMLVREQQPDLPFIVVSGSIGEERAIDLLRAGADDYVVKGRGARLVAAVERELRRVHYRRDRDRLAREVYTGKLRLEALLSKVPAVLWTTDDALSLTLQAGGIDIPGLPPISSGQSLVDALGATSDMHAALAAHRQALTGQAASYAIEAGGRTLDARVQPLEDDRGRAIGVIGVAVDITERMETQAALAREAASVRLLHGVGTAANAARTLNAALRSALAILIDHTGWSLGHCYIAGDEGQPLRSSGILWPDNGHQPRFREATESSSFASGEGLVGTVFAAGAPVWCEEPADESRFVRRKAARADGIRVAVASPVWVGSGVAAVLELFHTEPQPRDERLLEDLRSVGAQLGRVFERHRSSQLERQLLQTQKMEAIGQLASGVAHDFNNMLTVIRCQILLAMENDQLPESFAADLSLAADAADRASGLTRRLLSFSRDQQSQRRVIQLGDTIEDLVGMIRRLIGDDVRVEIDVAPETPPIQADVRQMEQVLMNLAVNARDAMPEGGTLHIRVEPRTVEPGSVPTSDELQPGPYAALIVSDTGHGIPEDVKSRLFEPFFTTKPADRGTGLGLSTVHGIVRRHGGHIWVNGAEGEGASFTILIPKAAVGQQQATLPPAQPHRGPRPRTVLVVEDDGQVAQAIERVLERSGHRSRVSSSAENALRFLRTAEGAAVELVLTDAVMPGMGGAELARLLTAERPHVPVLLMSGYDPSELSTSRRPPRGVEILQKPIEPRALLDAVDGIFAQR